MYTSIVVCQMKGSEPEWSNTQLSVLKCEVCHIQNNYFGEFSLCPER